MNKFYLMILILSSLGLSSCGHNHYEYVIGQQGPQGEKGDKGDPGVNATACYVTSVAASPEAPNGGSLITCPTSSSLVLNGAPGATGATGAAGTNGTVVTSVSLCSGTTTYPSKFVEVAFKINGKLYAVYSANGGFMTELPPGNYTSNGIGSSCNFTVNSDLTISH